MPFGKWDDFLHCQKDMQSQGHSEESARRICGAIQNRIENKTEPEGLTEVEKKSYDEGVRGFQRIPQQWWDACVSKNEGSVSDTGAYCGWLWWNLVEGQGVDPTKLLTKNSEYIDQFNKTKEFVKQFSETATLKDEEIFAAGTWNGDKYTREDLEEIADNFKKLKDEVKPPVKLGHSENQRLLEADDLPAGGWVKSLKVAGDKLLADIVDVPRKIYELIKNRAYRRKSAEIYPDYTGADGKRYGKVLRAIAILGGATPAISTLGDIQNLYSEKGNQKFKIYNLEGGERMKTLGISVSSEAFGEDFKKKIKDAMKVAFGEDVILEFNDNGADGDGSDSGDSSDNGSSNDDSETIDALKKKILELEGEVEDYRKKDKGKGDDGDDMEMMKSKKKALEKELDDTNTKLAESKKKVDDLSKAKDEAEKKKDIAEKKFEEQAVATHSADVKAFIEKAKADGRILPAHEQLLSVLMKQIDRKAVIKFTEKDKDGKDVQVEKTSLEMVKAFVESLPKAVEFREISRDTREIDTFTADGGRVKIGGQEFEVDDVKLAASARKYAEEHKVSYDIALTEVAKGSR